MSIPSYSELKGKDCCFNCAYYNTARVNIIGAYCTDGISSYQSPAYVCRKHRDTMKNDRQLKEDYKVLEKKCR